MKDLTTADDLGVELCGMTTGHTWDEYAYTKWNRPHVSWRCVHCHTVMCGDFDEADPCVEPYHHLTNHRARSGVTWPLGGSRPEPAYEPPRVEIVHTFTRASRWERAGWWVRYHARRVGSRLIRRRDGSPTVFAWLWMGWKGWER